MLITIDTTRKPRDLYDAIHNLGWTEDIYALYEYIGDQTVLTHYIELLGRCSTSKMVVYNVMFDLYVKHVDCYMEVLNEEKFVAVLMPFIDKGRLKDLHPVRNIRRKFATEFNANAKELKQKRDDFLRSKQLLANGSVATYLGNDSEGFGQTSLRVVSEMPTPSDMTVIVRELAKAKLPSRNEALRLAKQFAPQEKIDHNGLQEYAELINFNVGCRSLVSEAYDKAEADGNMIRMNVIRNLTKLYLENMAAYKGRGVALYRLITDEAVRLVSRSANRASLTEERIANGVAIIVADAFMECEIFENPHGYDHP